MARNNRNSRNNDFFQVFQDIGSKTGAFIAIGTLVTMGTTAGAYLTKINKDTEILDIKTQNSLVLIQKHEEASELREEIRKLKFKIANDSIRKNNAKK